MNLFGLNRRRSDTLLLAFGQLILIGYLFQIVAFDHWHSDPSQAAGVIDSATHAAHEDHCHGAPSSCADAGAGFAQFSSDQTPRLPSSAPSLVLLMDARTAMPPDVSLASLTEPPRAAT